jgi:hypothetical protein
VRGAVDSTSAAEAVDGFLGVIELAQLRVAVEPAMKVQALPKVQSEAVTQQHAADSGRTAIAGALFASAHERRVEQPEDVELVGVEAPSGPRTARRRNWWPGQRRKFSTSPRLRAGGQAGGASAFDPTMTTRTRFSRMVQARLIRPMRSTMERALDGEGSAHKSSAPMRLCELSMHFSSDRSVTFRRDLGFRPP